MYVSLLHNARAELYSLAGGLGVPPCVLVNTEVGLSYKGRGAISHAYIYIVPTSTQKRVDSEEC